MASTDSGVSYTTTFAGWAAVLAVAGGAAYLTSQRKKSEHPAPPRRVPHQVGESKKDKSAKRHRLDTFHSDSQDGSKGKGKASAQAGASAPQPKWLSNAADTSDDGVDNAEFARQFANVREGTKFTGKNGAEKKKQKSVKQSQAAKIASKDTTQDKSASSSTTGADADDDQSLTNSPEVTPADASGVRDMLEPAPAGPSVLRIVGTDKVKAQPPKKAKEPEKVETKKQRQQRAKREAEKALAQESEAARKKLEENQRRTARIARGEHAKDGSQFMAHINGNQGSAWGAPSTNGSTVKASSPAAFLPVQPLDTFDSNEVPSSSNASTSNEASQPMADSWVTDLPSEEEQIKKLQELEEWSTVPSKAAKRSQKKPTPAEKSESAPAPAGPAAAAAPVRAAPVSKGQNGRPQKALQSFGSFSALTPKDSDENETPKAVDEEKEWDV